jgi:hypothetical protein
MCVELEISLIYRLPRKVDFSNINMRKTTVFSQKIAEVATEEVVDVEKRA